MKEQAATTPAAPLQVCACAKTATLAANLTLYCRIVAAGATAKPKAKDERGLVKILVEECLKSRAVWLFAISYFLCVPAICPTRHFLFPVGLLSPPVIVAWRLHASAQLNSLALAVGTSTYDCLMTAPCICV